MNALSYCKKQRAIRDNTALTINEKAKQIMLMVAEDLDKVFQTTHTRREKNEKSKCNCEKQC